MMIRNEFPNIEWLKNTIQQRKAVGLGWPTCIINAKNNQVYRPNIDGTLSIFMNLQGTSFIKTDSETIQIPTSHYFITNNNQAYTLTVESLQTETYNIHFSKQLIEETYANLVDSEDFYFETTPTQDISKLLFLNKLHPKNSYFNNIIYQIQHGNPEALEIHLSELLTHLLFEHRLIIRKTKDLNIKKKSTQKDILNKLIIAENHLLNPTFSVQNLEVLSKEIGLSKFHFLRLFKTYYGITPHQFLMDQKLQLALQLLNKKTLEEICYLLNYQDVSTLVKLIKNKKQLTPSQLRKLAIFD